MVKPWAMITLDLDDTLWPCMPVIKAAEEATFAHLASLAPNLAAEHDVASLRQHRLQLAQNFPEIAHDLTEVRRRSLQQLLDQHGSDPDLAESALDTFRQMRNRVEPYAEVKQVLQTWRERFVLVALSNGNAQLEQTPLAGYFDYAFTAEQVGAAKPAPALFHAASEAAGIALSHALHIGDDPLRDIEAARRLGMSTAWINRANQTWPSDLIPADFMAEDLLQLTECLFTR